MYSSEEEKSNTTSSGGGRAWQVVIAKDSARTSICLSDIVATPEYYISMPPKKSAKLAHADDEVVAVSIHQLEDIMADVLGWLCVKEIMGKRGVCKKWKEAVKKTFIPLCDFIVDNERKCNSMEVMATEMPNLQQIKITNLGGVKYSDGEDPNERLAAGFANWTSHDIGIISNFSQLRVLEIAMHAPLNGRYPVLFGFPMLQKLSIKYCHYLKWDLGMLVGLPVLKELECDYNHSLTGNISSLRVLKDTLEEVTIKDCEKVEGNFMDLADFPHLKELKLRGTAITGDIRDISLNDFPSLEYLNLEEGVYGGFGYQLQRISDAPDVTRAVYLLNKQRSLLGTVSIETWFGRLSEDSPDWYESEDLFPTPFYIRFVQAGPRIGYRWQSCYHEGSPCEVNWLDPEPDRKSNDYEQYIEELNGIENEMESFRGFHQPPTEEEYDRLWEEFSEVLP